MIVVQASVKNTISLVQCVLGNLVWDATASGASAGSKPQSESDKESGTQRGGGPRQHPGKPFFFFRSLKNSGTPEESAISKGPPPTQPSTNPC